MDKMLMKNTRTVYSFDELSNEAREKAREWFRSGDDMPFLGEYVREVITQELDELGYHAENLEVFYSLASCQGDGVSFSGTLTRKNSPKTWHIKKTSHQYQHECTMSVEVEDEDGNSDDELVTDQMRTIAKKAERLGYKYIDAEQSNERVDETIIANEYTFTSDGKRLDADPV